MNIPLFQWIVISTFILFIEPKSLKMGVWRLRKISDKFAKETIPVFYDGDCVFCQRTAKILACLDVLKKLRFINFREEKTIKEYPSFDPVRAEREIALYSKSKWFHGYLAFKYISWKLPPLWPIVWMFYFPGASFVGHKVYRWVSNHRYLILGRTCSTNACFLYEDTQVNKLNELR
jgi:predicted DCC family thiol-disulfide oxidoreductase YuxK